MNYFRYKQFNKDVITVAVGYYLRYALSYRDISEILRERGVNVHHSTVYRWVQEYAPILYQIWKKKHKKAYYGVPSAYEEFVSIRNRFKNFAVILYI